MSRRRLVIGLAAVLVAGVVVSGVPAAAGGPMAETVSTMSWLHGIACRPDRTCLGAGEQANSGAIGVLGATGVGQVRRVRGTRSFRGIACLPGGDCLAVGKSVSGAAAVVRTASDGTPLTTYGVSGATDLYDVACPTADTCLATGSRYVPLDWEATGVASIDVPVFVVVTNGVPGSAQRYPRGLRPFSGIDCPRATRCVAVGYDADVALLTNSGTTWTVTASRPPGSDVRADISCPTPSACFAISVGSVATPDGFIGVPAVREVSPDGVLGAERVLNDRSGILNAISCVAHWTCTAVGQEHASSHGLAIDVTPSAPPVATVWGNSNFFTDVSCIAAGVCGIVGALGGLPPPVFAWEE